MSSLVLDEFFDEFEIMPFEKFDQSVRIVGIDVQDFDRFSWEYSDGLVLYRNAGFLVQDEIVLVFDGVDVFDFFRAQSEESIILVYPYRFYGIVEEIQRFRIMEIPMVFFEILQVIFR